MRPALFALAALTACAYVDPDPAWADRQARFVDAQAFTPAKDELRGIDLPAPADRVEKGDRILYGIEFDKGGTKRNWLVHVEVVDPQFELPTDHSAATVPGQSTMDPPPTIP